MGQENYKTYIQREFERRKAKNAYYSLRAFARDLDMAPSTLSEILAGKKGLSASAAAKLARRLGLDESSNKTFELSAKSLHGRSRAERSAARKELKSHKELLDAEPPRVFTIVDWVTEAVLLLSTRENQSIEDQSLASALGIPKNYVSGCIRFLRRLGFVKPEKEGEAFLSHRGKGKRLNIDYESILEQAMKAYNMRSSVDNQFVHEPLLLRTSDIPEARRIILRSLRDLKKLHDTSENSQLFYVSTQLFALEPTKKENL
jgi:plasmid maintenance system antidote protein VapI